MKEVEEQVFLCPTCKSKGFAPSVILGQCEFCDGTFNGDGPDKEVQIADLGLATERRFKLLESCISRLSFHAVGE